MPPSYVKGYVPPSHIPHTVFGLSGSNIRGIHYKGSVFVFVGTFDRVMVRKSS